MKLRAALTIALALPAAGALAGPTGPTYAAVAVCQGQPATIEGSTGTITGTEGNDVIVSTGADTRVEGLGGNDLICVVGGEVSTGLGDDSVLSTGPVASLTTVHLFGGNDTYAGGPGNSYVSVDEVTSFHATMTGTGFGTLELDPTSTPGTGTVEFETAGSLVYAFGLKQAAVDLAAQTVTVDGLLSVTTVGLKNATATGCKVRLKGDAGANTLNAYGHDVVIKGAGGGDRMGRVGNGFDVDLPRCGRYKSVFKGEGGPDHLYGRLGDDIFIGGAGRDVANGAGGVDTCRTEVRRNCER